MLVAVASGCGGGLVPGVGRLAYHSGCPPWWFASPLACRVALRRFVPQAPAVAGDRRWGRCPPVDNPLGALGPPRTVRMAVVAVLADYAQLA